MPRPYTDLQSVIQKLAQTGKWFSPGVLIEMLPDFSKDMDKLMGADINAFDQMCWVNTPASTAYRCHASVKWGFGQFADQSWRLDARYHAFGTIDSLRKIPLLQYRPNWHLNQGFHSLRHSNFKKNPEPDPSIFEGPIVFPVLHYKLSRLFDPKRRQSALSHVTEYHDRTKLNIQTIFGGDKTLAKLERLRDFIVPAEDVLSADWFGPIRD